MALEILNRRVNEAYKDGFDEKLVKLAKKAARLNAPVPTWTWSAPMEFPRWRDGLGGSTDVPQKNRATGEPREPDYFIVEYDVTVEAETIALAGGWTLAAAIDFIEDEDRNRVAIIRAVPGGDEIPARYQTTTGFCDHCQTERRRNAVYVVRADNGDYRQVGTDCVTAMLGVNPALLAAWWKTHNEILALSGNDDDLFSSGREREYYTPTMVVRVAIAAIRAYGWTKSEKARWEGTMSGASMVRSLLGAKKEYIDKNFPLYAPVEADGEQAEAIVEWARDMDGDTEYAHNIRTLATVKAIEPRFIGIFASVVLAYDRAQQRAKEAEGFVSEPLAEVGARVTFRATLLFERGFPSNYGTGMTYLLVFRTDDGKRVTWFSSNSAATLNTERGERVVVKATVKKVGERNGVIETQVTRGAIHFGGCALGDGKKKCTCDAIRKAAAA